MFKTVALTFALFVAWCECEVVTMTDEIRTAFVDAHNRVRATVNSPPVTWDNTVEQFAASGTPASQCQFRHTQGNSYGENLAWFWPVRQNNTALAEATVQGWGDEVNNYQGQDLRTNWLALCFPNPRPRDHQQCGHYTQVVWSRSTSIGCAINRCSDNSNIVVCNYNPAGNVAGENAY